MFLQDHKSLIFTRIGIFSLELMPAYSAFQTVKVRQIVKVSHHYHPLKPRNCGAILPTKELPLNGS